MFFLSIENMPGLVFGCVSNQAVRKGAQSAITLRVKIDAYCRRISIGPKTHGSMLLYLVIYRFTAVISK